MNRTNLNMYISHRQGIDINPMPTFILLVVRRSHRHKIKAVMLLKFVWIFWIFGILENIRPKLSLTVGMKC